MKKLLALALAALMVVSMVACGSSKEETYANRLEKIKAQGYITVAISPDFGPYEFIDPTKTGDDQVVGCEVEFAKYVAEYLGVELKIEQMDFSTCQAAVTAGNVDFSASGYAPTPTRAETMELSTPYVWENNEGNPEQVTVVLKADADKYQTAEDFAGLTVAAQNGSLQWNLVEDQLPDDVTLEPISSLADGIMLVISGKVHAMACAYDTAVQYCQNYDSIAVSPYAFEYESVGNVALVQKGEVELVNAINEAIRKAAEEHLFAQWRRDAMALAEELNIDFD